MLTGLDFLYICLGIGFLILVGIISLTLYSLTSFLLELKRVIKEIKFMKANLKIRILSFIQKLIGGGKSKGQNLKKRVCNIIWSISNRSSYWNSSSVFF